MVHHMHLQPEPFEKILSGQKTIELRLYDEKRQQILEGDTIEFSCLGNEGQKFTAMVKALHLYPSFQMLYENLPLIQCGYTTDTLQNASYKDMEQYYPAEEQKHYGVVGIELTDVRGSGRNE